MERSYNPSLKSGERNSKEFKQISGCEVVGNRTNMGQRSSKEFQNKTKKNIGGDITKNNVFKYILSIGYEFETTGLIKLMEMYDSDEILYNTDTARKDIETFQSLNIDIDDYDLIRRQEETVEIDAVDDNNQLDRNISFLITNDIANTPFIKHLDKLCDYDDVSDEEEDDEDAEEEDDEYAEGEVGEVGENEDGENEDGENEDGENEDGENEDAEEPKQKGGNNEYKKNQLYKIQTKDKSYDIHFIFSNESYCNIFSDVEWILTYYNPKQTSFYKRSSSLHLHNNEDVILNTYMNAIKNIDQHLSDLEKIECKLIIKKPIERVIRQPKNRILFHKPNTNLYYLQSHYYNQELDINDICITPQMTFTCDILHIAGIMKVLINDAIKINVEGIRESKAETNQTNSSNIFKATADARVELLQKIEYISSQLIQNYNKEETTYKFEKIPGRKRKSISEFDIKNYIKKIQNYIFLILYKLYCYYNYYITTEKNSRKYFKNNLFFNVRHSNFLLYEELKHIIREFFDLDDDRIVIEIIHKLFIQPDLLRDLIKVEGSVHRKVFDIKYVLEKNATAYGNPAKSLISYFHFFEDPIDPGEDQPIKNDWLEYKQIDSFSTKMDLKDDIIFIEFRSFHRYLHTYMYKIADTELRKNMTEGICNKMTNKYTIDINGTSLGNLKRFREIYLGIHQSKKSKSRSKSRKSKSPGNSLTRKIRGSKDLLQN